MSSAATGSLNLEMSECVAQFFQVGERAHYRSVPPEDRSSMQYEWQSILDIEVIA